jgi:hypothetical protein
MAAPEFPDLPDRILRMLTAEERAILDEDDRTRVTTFLSAGFVLLVDGLRKMVVGYWRLRRLGVSRDEIAIELPYIEQMASGQVLIELVAALSWRPSLMDMAARLPIADQQRFADNAPIPVLEAHGDPRMVPAQLLSKGEIDQVFDRYRLRNASEQAQYLSDQRKAAALTESVQEEPVKIVRGGIVVTRPVKLSLARLRAIVADLERSSSRRRAHA